MQHHYAEAFPSHGAVFSEHCHFHVSHDDNGLTLSGRYPAYGTDSWESNPPHTVLETASPPWYICPYMSPLGHIVERCGESCHVRDLGMVRIVRKRQTAKYFLLPSSVTHAKEVCSSTFGIALAPLTAEKATTLSSDRPPDFPLPLPRRRGTIFPAWRTWSISTGFIASISMPLPIAAQRLVDAAKTFARTIPAALPQWSLPFCPQHRSILTHSNAFQRFCCCRGRVRTILPLPARPPPFFRYPSPFAVKTAPSKTA